MDSLTQIVLGAAVGEVVLGSKVGNKAMLYGAIAGTIPDLDVLSSHFLDTSRSLEFHRGLTHSIVFSALFAPLFGWLVSRYERHKNLRDWSWLFFWGLVTHPLLDAFTTWGTQFFWPFDVRLAFKTIFVIDPLYTLPFLICLILAMIHKRTNPKRRKWNLLGLGLSSGYILLTVCLKVYTYFHFTDALKSQGINYIAVNTRPAAFNTVLWNATIDTGESYLLADYSIFDTPPISFHPYQKNHHLLGKLVDDQQIQRMIHISKGWFIITEEDGSLFFNDLRFGLLTTQPGSTDFVFKYRISTDHAGQVNLKEVEKDPKNARKMLSELWNRVKGN